MRTAPAWRGRSSPHVHNPTSDREGISTCAKRTLVVEWCSRMQKHPMVAEVCSYMYITPLGEVGHLCMCTAPPQPRRVFAHAQCPPRGGRLSRMCIAPPNGEIVRACAQLPLVAEGCSLCGGRAFTHAHSAPSWPNSVRPCAQCPLVVEGSRMRTKMLGEVGRLHMLTPPLTEGRLFVNAHRVPSWRKGVRACAQVILV